MKFDAFTAGVTLGGLRNKSDIKLLICYLLASIKQPLTKDDIVFSLQENGLANYFEINDALSDLISNGNICPDPNNSDAYIITKSGQIIANQLNTALPISIREKAVAAAVNLLARAKRETENTVTVEKKQNGYQVTCNISGDGNMNLMTIGLFVPDINEVNLVKQNFQANPNVIYSCMLALMTKNTDLAKEALHDICNQNKS